MQNGHEWMLRYWFPMLEFIWRPREGSVLAIINPEESCGPTVGHTVGTQAMCWSLHSPPEPGSQRTLPRTPPLMSP